MNRKSLADYAAKNLGSSDLVQEIAAYLIENNATSEVGSLARDILTNLEENQAKVELSAITAHPLGASDKELIKKFVKDIHPAAKEIIINERIDKSVIGGLKLDFPHSSLDMTVRSKLNKLRAIIS